MAVQVYVPSSPACVGLMVRPVREMVNLAEGVITAEPFLHTIERELDEVAWQLNWADEPTATSTSDGAAVKTVPKKYLKVSRM